MCEVTVAFDISRRNLESFAGAGKPMESGARNVSRRISTCGGRLQRTLTISEFDDRMGLVMQSKTRGELEQILADLPQPTALPRPQMPLRPCRRIIAAMGGRDNKVMPSGAADGPLVRANGCA